MLDELKVITQVGVAGVAIFFFFRVIQILVKLQENHLAHIEKSLGGIENKMEELVEHLKAYLTKL